MADDLPESLVQQEVHKKLRLHYGPEAVTEEKWLPRSARQVDFWVDGDLINLAVEVEDNWEGVINGLGQAFLYAAHSNETIPVVAFPARYIQEPEYSMLRSEIILMPVPIHEDEYNEDAG